MAANSDAGRIGVWGRSGSGKSTYVKRRIKGLKRVVVFDPMGEYGAHGFKVVRAVDDVRKAMLADYRGFRVAFVPRAGQEIRDLARLSAFLLQAQAPFERGKSKLGLTLVVEEMSFSFPNPAGPYKCQPFARVCSTGRHFGIEVIGVSQRVQEVATRFRDNCTESVSLMQKDKGVEAAARCLGVRPEQILGLNKLEYLHEKDGKITKGKLTFR